MIGRFIEIYQFYVVLFEICMSKTSKTQKLDIITRYYHKYFQILNVKCFIFCDFFRGYDF